LPVLYKSQSLIRLGFFLLYPQLFILSDVFITFCSCFLATFVI